MRSRRASSIDLARSPSAGARLQTDILYQFWTARFGRVSVCIDRGLENPDPGTATVWGLRVDGGAGLSDSCDGRPRATRCCVLSLCLIVL